MEKSQKSADKGKQKKDEIVGTKKTKTSSGSKKGTTKIATNKLKNVKIIRPSDKVLVNHFRDATHKLRYDNLNKFEVLPAKTLDWKKLSKNPRYADPHSKFARMNCGGDDALYVHICGQEAVLTAENIGQLLNIEPPKDFDYNTAWRVISGKKEKMPSKESQRKLLKSDVKLAHHFISNSLWFKKGSQEYITKDDVWLLYCTWKGIKVNLAQIIINKMKKMALKNEMICGYGIIIAMFIRTVTKDTETMKAIKEIKADIKEVKSAQNDITGMMTDLFELVTTVLTKQVATTKTTENLSESDNDEENEEFDEEEEQNQEVSDEEEKEEKSEDDQDGDESEKEEDGTKEEKSGSEYEVDESEEDVPEVTTASKGKKKVTSAKASTPTGKDGSSTPSKKKDAASITISTSPEKKRPRMKHANVDETTSEKQQSKRTLITPSPPSISFLRRLHAPLFSALLYREAPYPSVRSFSTRAAKTTLNDANPNYSNRPPKETILLDGCDFEHWLFDALLYGFDLAGYDDGSMVPPKKEIKQDGKKKLVKLYANKTRSRIMDLKNKLNTTKRGTLPVSDYFDKMKNIVDDLNLAGVAVDEDDLVLSTLNGVSQEFREIAAAIKARESPISFEELHDKLTSFELHLKRENISDVSIPTTNHVKKPKNSNENSFPPKKHNRNFSSNDKKFSSVTCQLCDKPGHSAKKCHQGKKYFDSKPSANLAQTNSTGKTWCMDSGASHHVTSELQNLSLKSDYDGTDEIMIGDGSGFANGSRLNTGHSVDGVYQLPSTF
ncbi:hypothetical protein CCACVL1_16032 [Corchorus capsularis]|uniref:CCHC-type domain-containing protein n=1 Tax=Corchorus capsularis TaxID=210143 RepID=A0A1R3HZR9_COCAP|nr:hypothetical protein CCACVL1_16032 [Corchorus capsularis]